MFMRVYLLISLYSFVRSLYRCKDLSTYIYQTDVQIRSILIYDGYTFSCPVAYNQILIFVAPELS